MSEEGEMTGRYSSDSPSAEKAASGVQVSPIELTPDEEKRLLRRIDLAIVPYATL